MKIEQKRWDSKSGWKLISSTSLKSQADIVFVFAGEKQLQRLNLVEDLTKLYPQSILFGCSTAGEICATEVMDDTIVLTAVKFGHTTLKTASIEITSMEDSYKIGQKLINLINKNGLKHVFVLSDGLNINGSSLVRGMVDQLPDNVTITGGLSGDAGLFQKTFVLSAEGVKSNRVAIVGFYSDCLSVSYSSFGGWDPFGPNLIITKSKDNVLYELSNQPALSLYKTYIGEHSKELPASGLLFPLAVRSSNRNEWVVRTLLAVNQSDNSMTFAGDMPKNAHVRFMKASDDRLIDGARDAAQNIHDAAKSNSELAILISCVGRKMVLKSRVKEEVEAVQKILGKGVTLAGFYSYGEISPFAPDAKCELHNQTMTITSFSEKECD